MNIKNMKLKYRLAGIYLLTAVLPVIVLFTFSYGQMKHILIERDTKSIQNFVNQAGAGIDAQLEVYNNLSKRFRGLSATTIKAIMKCTTSLCCCLTRCYRRLNISTKT